MLFTKKVTGEMRFSHYFMRGSQTCISQNLQFYQMLVDKLG